MECMYGLVGKINTLPGIGKGKPLIAGFSNRIETMPVGGQGLKS